MAVAASRKGRRQDGRDQRREIATARDPRVGELAIDFQGKLAAAGNVGRPRTIGVTPPPRYGLNAAQFVSRDSQSTKGDSHGTDVTLRTASSALSPPAAEATRRPRNLQLQPRLESARRRPRRRRGAPTSTTPRGSASRCPTPGTRTTPFVSHRRAAHRHRLVSQALPLPPGSDGKKVFLEFEGVRFGGRSLGQRPARRPARERRDGVRARRDRRRQAAGRGQRRRRPHRQRVELPREGHRLRPTSGTTATSTPTTAASTRTSRLHVADKLYQTLPLYSNLGTTGVYVYATDIDIPGTVRDDHRRVAGAQRARRAAHVHAIEVALDDMDGKIVATFDGERRHARPGETTTVQRQRRVDGPEFLELGLRLPLQRRHRRSTSTASRSTPSRTRTGFRKTEFANGMFKLNDRVLHLKGYAQRTTNEWPASASTCRRG